MCEEEIGSHAKLRISDMIARELGVFTAEEVLNLGVGQAFVHSGISADTFNIQSYAKPNPLEVDPTPRIKALTRDRYARPVAEAELGVVWNSKRIPDVDDAGWSANPEDPSENDLVV